jgi:hypothetical protein
VANETRRGAQRSQHSEALALQVKDSNDAGKDRRHHHQPLRGQGQPTHDDGHISQHSIETDQDLGRKEGRGLLRAILTA